MSLLGALHVSPLAESDANYAVFVEQSWLTNRAVVEKSSNRFSVRIQDPAPAKAQLDWMLVVEEITAS